MRKCTVGSLLGIMMMFISSGGLSAQNTPSGPAGAKAVPRSSDGKPDFFGIWRPRPLRNAQGANAPGADAAGAGANPAAKDPYDVPGFGFLPVDKDGVPQEPPLQPWALEKYRAARDSEGVRDRPIARGAERLDPAMYCLQSGFPRVYTFPDPFEILHTLRDRIVQIFPETDQARQIYLDGRKHPSVGVSFMGHAIGKWDKETLVVETVGLVGGNAKWLDLLGTPHSDNLTVVERIKRPTYDTLEIDLKFDDPGAFTKPWEGKKRYYLMPADWEYAEYVLCDIPKALGGTDEFSY